MEKFLKLTEALLIAIIEKLGGEEAALSFLYSEPENKNWAEKDGIIYFNVVSGGTTGEQWISWLNKNSCSVSEWAKPLFLSRRFKPTNGVITEVAIIKKTFSGQEPGREEQEEVKLMAKGLKFKEPNPEVICLILQKFSELDFVEMDLDWLMSMHKPIGDVNSEELDGEEHCLGVAFYDDGDNHFDGHPHGSVHHLCYNNGIHGGLVYAKSTIKIKSTSVESSPIILDYSPRTPPFGENQGFSSW